MGFTIEDMLLIAKDKYEMELLAGENGWSNSISWLLMIEDTTITKDFRGKELVVTTGLGFDTEEKLLQLVELLDQHHSAGLIVNTGHYIKEIPQAVLDYCDEKDLPLMTSPWNIVMSEMIKDLTVRIFLQSQTDEQMSAAFMKAIERPELEEYKDTLSSAFDVDGEFQIALFTTGDLDTMDTVERKRIGYRLAIYLENISHNAHFFYYAGYFTLIFSAVGDHDMRSIIKGFGERAKRRMPEKEVYVGVGSKVVDASNIHTSFERAVYAAERAVREKRPIFYFDELGIERLFYSVKDERVLDELGPAKLEPLIAYDKKHDAQLLQTFYSYLKNDGSIQAVADELFIHKNTILYRMNKIKELLQVETFDGEKKLEYFLALKLCIG